MYRQILSNNTHKFVLIRRFPIQRNRQRSRTSCDLTPLPTLKQSLQQRLFSVTPRHNDDSIFKAQKRLHKESIQDPEKFWKKASSSVDWIKPFEKVLEVGENGKSWRWFAGGKINVAYNALDRHVLNGRANQIALIYDSPMTNSQKKYTYAELLDQVKRFANVLLKHGVKKGSTVLIYMPMIPESVIAMLACARIGAVHCVVFGGFAPKELAVRIDDSKCTVIVAGSCGLEPNRVIPYQPLIKSALKMSQHQPKSTIYLQRPESPANIDPLNNEYNWNHETTNSSVVNECTPVLSTDPLYVLYTSGTTGAPKGIVRSSGDYAVALAWSMRYIYDIQPGDVFWAASDIGWVVGHSYIVYGPLLAGATTVLFEGKPTLPDSGVFFRVLQEHSVRTFFTAPTALRAIKREDPDGLAMKRYALDKLRAVFLAGERSDPDTVRWCQKLLNDACSRRKAGLGVDVIDHWWQTETGWPISGVCLGLQEHTREDRLHDAILPDSKIGSAGLPIPGFDVQVLKGDSVHEDLEHERYERAGPNELGNIVCKLPLPPGCSNTLLNDEDSQRYRKSYLSRIPGKYYDTSDGGILDDDGFISVLGRIDDVINVAGHRLSTGAMEEVVSMHPKVAECAVIGKACGLKGEIPVAFVVLKHFHVNSAVMVGESKIIQEVKESIRDRIGAFAKLDDVFVVNKLPKTRSGKVLRRTLRTVLSRSVDGSDGPIPVPPTIEDESVIPMLVKKLMSKK